MNMPIKSNRVRIALASLFLLPLAAIGIATCIRSAEAAPIFLVTVPYYCSGGNAISHIYSGVPEGTVFYLWDSNLQTFSTASKGTKGAWSGGSREVLPGEGFFYSPPTTEPIIFTGTAPTSPVTINASAKSSLLGYPLGSNIVWTDTSLANALPTGSIVSFWNSTGGWYKTFLKAPAAKGGGWGGEASNFVIGTYDGFSVQQPAGATNLPWTE